MQRFIMPLSKALTLGPYVTMGSHSFTRTIPAFTPQPQAVTVLWLVFIAPTHEAMARLS